jgi:Trypsin-co-occurring domain 1
MPARMVIELESGDKVLFGGSGTGPQEIGRLGNVAKATGQKFVGALGQLGQVVEILQNSVDQLAKKPDKIEIELRASLSSECNLWIVSGDGEAEFKVMLAWGKD